MAVVTITGSDVSGGSPSGGGVGGASNLTTAGAVPYVASAGVLTQDATKFFYNAANDQLGIGIDTFPLPNQKLYVRSVSGDARLILDAPTGSYAGYNFYSNGVDKGGFFYRSIDAGITVYAGALLRATFLDSGNIVFGPNTTDNNYKLDVAASGSSGTVRVYDQTATTGSTLLAVQAGAGQSSNNLQEWRNNAGTVLAFANSGGVLIVAGLGLTSSEAGLIAGDGLTIGSNRFVKWSTSTHYASGSYDTGLARNAAGVVEINNGTAGTLRDLLLRYLQNTGVTVATLPAAAAGNAGSRAYVTDANATTIGTTVAGGGANKVMVWSDGTNWKIYAS